ncbi:hypothetical protein D3C71_692760 [compost metagenome]
MIAHLTICSFEAEPGSEEKFASISPLIFQKSPAPTIEAKSATETSMIKSKTRSAKMVPNDFEKGTPSER